MVSDLALILVVAGVVTVVFRRLRQPVVLGYIVAGFVCGPHFAFFPTVTDIGNVQTWADIGVVFMMLNLGLEFSFKKIMKMGMGPFIAACTIIFCMICVGLAVGSGFGWSRTDSLFLGGMLAMSSTTIIFKALDDLGLKHKRFAGSVLSVLVIEDILGIALMVMLAMLAAGDGVEGGEFGWRMVRLAAVLVLWFTVGILVVPTWLRRYRRWISRETLLVIAVGLCFLMVVAAVEMGYSSAFGAFMAGSILAETVEAEKIGEVVAPVKDLFGAVFFVSVGMLVDPTILADYWREILALVVAVVVGQAIFGTGGFLLSGLPLRTSMECGFSMAQIGEFAFIIASLGVSLGVTASYLYPIAVAVSVVTTFLTPYMMRLANPAYVVVERCLPVRVNRVLRQSSGVASLGIDDAWRDFLKATAVAVVLYGGLSAGIIAVVLSLGLPQMCSWMDPAWARAICCVVSVAGMAPFLNGMVLRPSRYASYRRLRENRQNRLPLFFMVLVRIVLSVGLTFYALRCYVPIGDGLCWLAAVVVMALVLLSAHAGKLNMLIEALLVRNLNSRAAEAEAKGMKEPSYAKALQTHDLHIVTVEMPMSSKFGGLTLQELEWTRVYGVMVVAVIREGRRINTPGARVRLFPGDKLQVVGGDEELQGFADDLRTEVYRDEGDGQERAMLLRRLEIAAESPFKGKTVGQSRMREDYHCMLIGFEEGEHIRKPEAGRVFGVGDVVWVVGERVALRRLLAGGEDDVVGAEGSKK